MLLEGSDLSVIDTPKFVSMRTLTVSGQMSDESQHVCLTSQLSSQLHSTHMHPSIVSVLLNENVNKTCTHAHIQVCDEVETALCNLLNLPNPTTSLRGCPTRILPRSHTNVGIRAYTTRTHTSFILTCMLTMERDLANWPPLHLFA